MKLYLKHDFAGRITDEKRYPAGEYLSGSLPGTLGEYWVANGLADLIEPDAVAETPVEPVEEIPAPPAFADEPIEEAPAKPAKVILNKRAIRN